MRNLAVASVSSSRSRRASVQQKAVTEHEAPVTYYRLSKPYTVFEMPSIYTSGKKRHTNTPSKISDANLRASASTPNKGSKTGARQFEWTLYQVSDWNPALHAKAKQAGLSSHWHPFEKHRSGRMMSSSRHALGSVARTVYKSILERLDKPFYDMSRLVVVYDPEKHELQGFRGSKRMDKKSGKLYVAIERLFQVPNVTESQYKAMKYHRSHGKVTWSLIPDPTYTRYTK